MGAPDGAESSRGLVRRPVVCRRPVVHRWANRPAARGLEAGISVDPSPIRRPCSCCAACRVVPLFLLRSLLVLLSLQLTAGVGPTNRVCELVAGPTGRIRWLVGPECCVTGSERALEFNGGRSGAPSDRRAPDLVPPAQRAPGGSAPGRGAMRHGHTPHRGPRCRRYAPGTVRVPGRGPRGSRPRRSTPARRSRRRRR